MGEPQVGVEYRLVRAAGGGGEVARFTRYADGSAYVLVGGLVTIVRAGRVAAGVGGPGPPGFSVAPGAAAPARPA